SQSGLHALGIEENGLLHHCIQNIFLAAKMMEDTAGLDADLPGNIPYRGSLVALLLEQVSRLCQQSSPSALGVSNLPLLDHDGHIAHVACLRLLHTTSGNHIMVTAPAPILVALGELSAPVIPRA